MFAAARVTLKQHRFEVGAAVIAALAVGVWALVVEYRLEALNVPPGCIENWLHRVDGPEGTRECGGPMLAWAQILHEAGGIYEGEGVIPLSAMGILPFAVGLLGGVPIVARELEARTAQTAWSLNASRLRWLIRQAAPIAILLGTAVIFAALAVGAVVADDVAWGIPAWLFIGLHGPLVVVRAFGAFGIGLLVGTLLGRTLPAFVLGAAVSFAALFGAGQIREAWLATLEPVVIGETSPATGEVVMVPRAETTDWAWRTPDGIQISNEEGLALVPREVADQDPPEQPINSMEWLHEHGYELLTLGVTEEMALGWELYDGLIFGMVGVISLAGAIVLVNRSRPT
jgi:hypothetical protein